MTPEFGGGKPARGGRRAIPFHGRPVTPVKQWSGGKHTIYPSCDALCTTCQSVGRGFLIGFPVFFVDNSSRACLTILNAIPKEGSRFPSSVL